MLKPSATCVAIISLVSTTKRFPMYCTGNNVTNRYRAVPCISYNLAPCVSPNNQSVV